MSGFVRAIKVQEQVLLEAKLQDGYAAFIMAPHRLSSAQVALGSQWYFTQIGIGPRFKLIWVRETKELVAVEIKAQTGFVLPRGIEIFEHSGRYLLLGKFLEDEIAQLRQGSPAGGILVDSFEED